MKKNNNLVMISNIVCVVLVLLLVSTQFLPFWNCTGCKNHDDGLISISEYLWNTDDHRPVTKNMTQVYKDYFGPNIKDEDGKAWKFEANDVVTFPLSVIIAAIIGIVALFLKPNTMLPTVASCFGGAVSVFGYLTNLALESGQNWMIHLVVAVLVTLVSGAFLLISA